MKAYEFARLFEGWLREAQSLGQNRGIRVEAIQKWSGGNPGDSWCCEFWWMCNDVVHQGQFEMPRVQACQDVYDYAKKKGYIVSNPIVGDTFLYVNNQDHAHHIGFVTADGGASGIAGNTSQDGKSDNGNGVFEHGLVHDPAHIKFVRFPR